MVVSTQDRSCSGSRTKGSALFGQWLAPTAGADLSNEDLQTECHKTGEGKDSIVFECSLIELILGDLGGDASPRQATDSRATTHVAMRLFQRLTQVLLLDGDGSFAEELRQRPVEIDVK